MRGRRPRCYHRAMGRATARAITAIVAIAAAGCARWAREPRFGSLRDGARDERFPVRIETATLASGLRLALVDDPRGGQVTVDVRYLVGAADDPPARTGLAHLAEHASFLLAGAPGGPTLGDDLAARALGHGASTTSDATHFAAVIAPDELAAVLALEARRLAPRCELLDDAAFARERDVVIAEHALRATPLAATIGELHAALYGAGHPYARAIDGGALAAIGKAEVCAFLAARYTPGRAIVVVAGALPPDARALVERTLGAIADRPAPATAAIAPPHLAGATSRHTAPVTWPTALVAWREPTRGTPGAAAFDVLRERLTRELQVAARDRAWIMSTGVLALGGPRAPALAAVIEVADAGRLDDARREALERMEAAIASIRAEVDGGQHPRSLAAAIAWDGLTTRGPWIADRLQYGDPRWFAHGDLLAGDGHDWQDDLWIMERGLRPRHAHVALITPADGEAPAPLAITPAAGAHHAVPWRAAADPDEADRALAVPAAAPRVTRHQLANGLTVELAPDPGSPLVEARLIFPVGSAHERGARPGVATASALLLRPDRDAHHAPALYPRIIFATTRGTELATAVDETTTTFAARGLAAWADWHVWYLAWLVEQGRYNPSDLALVHGFAQDERRREQSRGDGRPGVALRARLFGADHPYAQPPLSIADALAALTAADLDRWRAAHYRAPGATLIVSGGFDPAAMRSELDELFGPWSDEPPDALPAIPPAAPEPGPAWLALDAPHAAAIELTIGFAVASHPVRDAAARRILAAMLEDALRELRDDLGASYGLDVAYADTGAGGTLLVRGVLAEERAGAALARAVDAIAALRDHAAEERAAFVRARRRAAALAAAPAPGALAAAAHLAALAALGAGPEHDGAVLAAIGAATPAQIGALAAADLAALHMTVQLRGRPAALDRAAAALGVTLVRP